MFVINRDDLLIEGLRLGSSCLAAANFSQAKQHTGCIRVVRSFGFLPHCYRLPVQGLRLRTLALVYIKVRQLFDTGRYDSAFGAEAFPRVFHSLTEEWLGLGKLSLSTVNKCEVVPRPPGLGAVWPLSFFEDFRCSLVHRLRLHGPAFHSVNKCQSFF